MKSIFSFPIYLMLIGSILFMSCDGNQPLEFSPVAKFSILRIDNEVVEFRNNSLNSTSWHWDFGDGNTSTEKDPTHSYAELGNYEVILTSFLEDKSDQTSAIAIVNTIFPMELTELSSPPFSSRVEGISFMYDGKGYSGFGLSNFEYKDELWSFDPSNQSWTQLNDAPKNFTRSVSFIIDGAVYIGLGQTPWGNGASEFYRYDIASDTYTSVGMFPTSVNNENWIDAVGFSFEGKGYVLGAASNFGSTAKIMEFNPDDNSWIEKAGYPGESSAGMVHFIWDGFLYVGMGDDSGNNGFNVTQDFWKYDIANNDWTQLSNFPESGRTDAIGFIYDEKCYIGFGFQRNPNTGSVESFPELWEYNVIQDEWTRTESMPIPVVKQLYHFVLGNKLYFGGGYDAGNSIVSDFYEYEF